MVVYGCRNAGILRRGSFDVESQTRITNSFRGGRTKGANHDIALLELRKILLQRLDSAGTEEDQHIVVERLALLEVVTYCAIHHSIRVLNVLAVKQFAKHRVVNITQGNEVTLGLVLDHEGNQVVNLACSAEENLALAILDVLLYVLSHRLCNAEILHVLRDGNAHLLGKKEEIVNGKARSKYDSGVLQNGDFLCTKLLWSERLYLDERTEHDLHIVSLGYIVVRRVRRGRLWLRDKYLLNHRLS